MNTSLEKTDPNTKKENSSDPNFQKLEAPQITLPKGGGAIKGIEEKFQVNASTGTSSLSVPVPMSSARQGFSPQLSINYNSGAGNGPFGLGWQLNLSVISRKTEKELPQYKDNEDSDTFIISGAEDLVPVLVKNGNKWEKYKEEKSLGIQNFNVYRFRPRIEGLMAHIEYWMNKSSGSSFWKTIGKDNVKTFYGFNENSRIEDPGDRKKIFKWLISHTYDDKGNIILYKYKKEDFAGISNQLNEKNRLNHCTNTYLKQVFYGNKTPYQAGSALPTEDDFMFQNLFDYGEHDISTPVPVTIHQPISVWDVRKDAFSNYKPGFEIRTYRRCRRILLFHHFDELPQSSYLVQSMSFKYDDDLEPLEIPTGISGFSYLKSVIQSGHRYDALTDSYQSKSLPAFTLNYQTHRWNTDIKKISKKNIHHAPSGLNLPKYQWVDLYGEGLSGILTEQTQGWYYKSNLGKGEFSPGKLIASKPNWEGLETGTLTLQDLEGDGSKSLVNYSKEPKGFFKLDSGGDWQSFQNFEKYPNLDLRNPHVKFIDLNGDGLPDLMVSEDEAYTWYAAEGKKGFSKGAAVRKPIDEEMGATAVFADSTQSIILSDMSGDGLTDIVRVRNGEICYWPNLGYGRFGSKVNMDNAPYFDHSEAFNPKFIHLTDIDGSGTSDIIYLGKDEFTVWLNLNGNAWSKTPHSIQPFPKMDNKANISIADLLGTGTSCIAYSSPLPEQSDSPIHYIDLMESVKPHLLSSFSNSYGKETFLSYTPSTHFYLEDKKAGKPWITRLPFPVQVVSKVEIREHVSQTRFVNEYSYHHGYYDQAEREFRGFGRVEQRDTESYEHFIRNEADNIVDAPLHQAPALTKTWYHTGAFIEKNNILKQYGDEYYQNAILDEHRLPDASLPSGLTAEETREAFRACKSMMLRQELYAEDDTPESAHPYMSTGQNCQIQLLQTKASNKHAIFLVTGSESITYSYERNPADPKIAHSLNLEIDDLGNILKSASVVYERLVTDTELPQKVNDEQKLNIIYTENQYTNDVDTAEDYLLRALAQSTNYELTGITPQQSFFSLSELKNAVFGAAMIQYHEQATSGIQQRIIERVRVLYYKNDLSGALPLGQMESRGISFESYQQAFNQDFINQIYAGRVTNNLLLQGQYRLSDDIKATGLFPNTDNDGVWWVPSGQIQYPANPDQHFYQPNQYTDPFGNTGKTSFDIKYHLFVAETEDDLGNKNTIETFNYRVLAPELVKDMNDNLTAVRFDLLGFVIGTAIRGKGNEADDFNGFTEDLGTTAINDFFNDPATHGPTLLQNASSRTIYDFSQVPIAAATIVRETHHQDALQAGIPSALLYTFEYTNGFGKMVMTKVQAESGHAFTIDDQDQFIEVDTSPKLRWIGKGRTVLNNKGKMVKQYEPFFSANHHYETDRRLVEIGFSPLFYYDPLGRLIKTDYQHGGISKTAFTSWKQQNFDPNDTVMDSLWYDERINGALSIDSEEKLAAEKTAVHQDSPQTVHFDSRGNGIYVIEHNKYRDKNTAAIIEEKYASFTKLDIKGQQLYVEDARDIKVIEYEYNMLGQVVRHISTDTGTRWMLNDCMGKNSYGWDTKGHRFSSNYDALHRLLFQKVRFPDNQEITFNRAIYGENQVDDKQLNLRGKLFQQFDNAGIVTQEAFDFRGNVLKGSRQYRQDYKTVADWTNIANIPVLPGKYETVNRLDALNKITSVTSPDGSILKPAYNATNLLKSITVDVKGQGDIAFVENINYNAKGQRTTINYANNTTTKYGYNLLTNNIISISTVRGTDNRLLRDLKYTYDPIGNVTAILDNSQQTTYFNNQAVTAHNAFDYDSLYRLVRASGREHIGQNSAINAFDQNRTQLSHPADMNAMQRYRQYYDYDPNGNMIKMEHRAGQGNFINQWTRNFTPNNSNNQLMMTEEGGNLTNYTYDAHGNVTSLPHLTDLTWDFQDRLSSIDMGGGGHAYYVYDFQGQRVRKVIERQGGMIEERLYIGLNEFYERRQDNTVQLARETLQVMDEQKRLALVETRISGDDGSPQQLIRYQYSNHIATASLELDELGNIISYEEYYPFGNTSFQSGRSLIEVKLKRYRYTGQERDEESGLYYHGARYYMPWLARWTSPDPAGYIDGFNLYQYVHNNPINLMDQSGYAANNDCLGDVGGLAEEKRKEEEKKAKEKESGDGKKKKSGDTEDNKESGNIGDAIKEFFEGIFESIGDFFEKIGEAIGAFFVAVWEFIKTSAIKIFEAIKTTAIQVWEFVKNAASQVWEFIKKKASEAWEAIKTFLLGKPGDDGFLEDLFEFIGHVTWGSFGTALGATVALFNLTIGNLVVLIHNAFTTNKDDWEYASLSIGGPGNEDDIIGLYGGLLNLAALDSAMTLGPFVLFNGSPQGISAGDKAKGATDVRSFYALRGTGVIYGSKTHLVTADHEEGHEDQNLIYGPFAPLIGLIFSLVPNAAGVSASSGSWLFWYDYQANRFSGQNSPFNPNTHVH